MKKCINCEKELEENIETFCKKCGKKLSPEQRISLLERELDNAIRGISR